MLKNYDCLFSLLNHLITKSVTVNHHESASFISFNQAERFRKSFVPEFLLSEDAKSNITQAVSSIVFVIKME